jgi:iron complex transport system permease protein
VSRRWTLPVIVAVVLVAVVASLFVGRVALPAASVVDGLQGTDPVARLIVYELRLPRALLALLVGGALGLSGAAMQGLLRNPLASPDVVGVTAGAALGAAWAIYFGLSTSFALATPMLGLVGALVTGSVTFALAASGGTLSLILAGAAISSLAAALLALALNFAPSPYAAYELTTWLLGSLTDRGWDHLALSAPFVLGGAALLALTGRGLDALALGETQAARLGVNLPRLRLMVLLGVGLSVGAATSVTGGIGFIGLVAPHLVRPFAGHAPSRTLLPSALVGAALLLLADMAARVIPTGLEVRVGVLTSLIGAPFFLWLVLRMRRATTP